MNWRELLTYEYHVQIQGALDADLHESGMSQYRDATNERLMLKTGATHLAGATYEAFKYHAQRTKEIAGDKTWLEIMGGGLFEALERHVGRLTPRLHEEPDPEELEREVRSLEQLYGVNKERLNER